MKTATTIWAVAVLSAFAAAQSGSAQAWKVRYLAGPFQLAANAKLELLVGDEQLTLRTRKSTVAEIPRQALSSITHTPFTFNRTRQVGKVMPGPGGGYGPGAGGYALLFLLAMAVASPMHGQSHCVMIQWNDGGVLQELLLEAGKDDYGAVMQALEKFSGLNWIDLQKDWTRARAELKKNKDNSYPFNLDRTVKQELYTLGPGPYRAILLPRGDRRGELYLFAGNTVEQKQLKAILPVEVQEGDGAADTVEYVPAGAAVSIARFRLGGKIITVLP